jgi:putative nucleotidyltransferase with HDIG domain
MLHENINFINNLINKNLISKEVLDYIIKKNDNDAYAVLIELSKDSSVDRQILGNLWGDSIEIAYVDLERTIINNDVFNSIPYDFAKKHKVVALYKFADVITVAVTNPKNEILLDKIEKLTESKVSPLFTFPDCIEKLIESNYFDKEKSEGGLSSLTSKLAKRNKQENFDKNVMVGKTDSYEDYENLPSVISEKVKKQWVEGTRSILQDAEQGKPPSQEQCDNLSTSIIEEVHNKLDIVKCINQLRISDEYTYSHCVNTAVLCSVFAKEFSFNAVALKEITLGAMLHDIGKMRIPKVILHKPDKLSREEMEIVKRHPELGYKMIKQMGASESIANMAYNHHEKTNGTGYPRSLNGSQLSVYDQIMSIVDVYDALISDRPYKKAIPFHQAINILFLEGKTSFNMAFLYKFVETVYNRNSDDIQQEFKQMLVTSKLFS